MKYYLVEFTEHTGSEEGARHQYAVAKPEHVKEDDVAEIVLLHMWTNDDRSGPDERWRFDPVEPEWTCCDRTFYEWSETGIPEADYSVLKKYLGWGWPDPNDVNWSVDVHKFRKEKEV